MCDSCGVESVGLRELRQDASALVRRVERGEVIEVTVAGRLAARLVPVPDAPRRWNRWDDIAGIFATTTDADWARDLDQVDQSVRNPWEGQE